MKELRQEFGFKLTELLPLTSLSKSTYYYQPHERKQKISDKKLLTIILKIKKHNLGYGYLRVTDQLHRLGHKINHKRVQRIMHQNHISGRIYNLRAGKYDSSKGPQGKKAKNKFHRKFKTDRPYQKIVTDVSEFRYGNMSMNERIYISPYKDLCGGAIIGFSISDHPNTEFVMEGLKQVIDKRPNLNYRMTIHSDQGIQYQSNKYRNKLKRAKIFQSMSRRGNCHDNAAMESFFHTMKVEMYFNQHYQTKEKLIKAIKKYLRYYNFERIRHTLKGKTPMEYWNLALEKYI
ncbi:IS3 family transposase [Lactobacillus rodentium]|nr:IS3 family transposase [Lactobacillus rodentium]